MPVRETFNYQGLDAIRVGRVNMGVNTTFVVYRLNGTVIDTGPSNQWKYVKPFIQSAPLKQLLLTHHHEDHSGNAGAIQKLTGVQAVAPNLTIGILKKGFRIPPCKSCSGELPEKLRWHLFQRRSTLVKKKWCQYLAPGMQRI
ncbi:MBL fold metallo-hydrolase [Microbulbifer sp. VAAF005]|uniref:MBL fold metallo-hydrolase n=1 Tax=Microbulbifer sp. VAAF005 TaxID=3034230 RepID=UPI0024AC9918|nr:MBL fold metallo-hydrolase [Microbulbifer sp. VAAF005]WHI48487.1 MBL fold metallo-hydrolase [Microbulbifer sp. VAAF005]